MSKTSKYTRSSHFALSTSVNPNPKLTLTGYVSLSLSYFHFHGFSLYLNLATETILWLFDCDSHLFVQLRWWKTLVFFILFFEIFEFSNLSGLGVRLDFFFLYWNAYTFSLIFVEFAFHMELFWWFLKFFLGKKQCLSILWLSLNIHFILLFQILMLHCVCRLMLEIYMYWYLSCFKICNFSDLF